MNITAIIITMLSGLSFLIGFFITKLFNNKKKMIVFSIGFAFAILIGLILLDLLPECKEHLEKWYLVILFALLGMGLLKGLDMMIPHHEHKGGHKHIEHISLMSFIAILLHNIIESTALYTTGLESVKAGALMAIGIACHNIPLGIQITSLSISNKKGLLYTSLLAISSVVGVLLFNVFNVPITDFIVGTLLSVTLGMLLYIIVFELFCEVRENYDTKEMFYGVFTGIAVIALASFL